MGSITKFIQPETASMLVDPFVPFITEGIFQKLNEIAPVRKLAGMAETKKSEAMVVAEWPEKIDSLRNPEVEEQIENIQMIIRAIRDIRSQYNKQPGEKLTASANAPQKISEVLNANSDLICRLGGLNEFSASATAGKPENAAAAIVNQIQVYVHNIIDVEAERSRLKKQKEQLENAIKSVQGKLNNQGFMAKAKPQVVEQTKQKLAGLTEQLNTVEKHFTELK